MTVSVHLDRSPRPVEVEEMAAANLEGFDLQGEDHGVRKIPSDDTTDGVIREEYVGRVTKLSGMHRV